MCLKWEKEKNKFVDAYNRAISLKIKSIINPIIYLPISSMYLQELAYTHLVYG